jgi:predicted RNA-binding Zn-ribbon protein involved in translation (DUF1610 family)
MKDVTFEEFQERLLDIQRARQIFIKAGLTKNITVAFALYQEILADEKKPIYVEKSQLNEDCPACGQRLRLVQACCSSTKMTKECRACGWKSYVE